MSGRARKFSYSARDGEGFPLILHSEVLTETEACLNACNASEHKPTAVKMTIKPAPNQPLIKQEVNRQQIAQNVWQTNGKPFRTAPKRFSQHV